MDRARFNWETDAPAVGSGLDEKEKSPSRAFGRGFFLLND